MGTYKTKNMNFVNSVAWVLKGKIEKVFLKKDYNYF